MGGKGSSRIQSVIWCTATSNIVGYFLHKEQARFLKVIDVYISCPYLRHVLDMKPLNNLQETYMTTPNSERLHLDVIRHEPGMKDVFTGALSGHNVSHKTLIAYATPDGDRTSEQVAQNVARMLDNNVTLDRGSYFGPGTPMGPDVTRIRISVSDERDAPLLQILKTNMAKLGDASPDGILIHPRAMITPQVVEQSKEQYFREHAVPVDEVTRRIPARLVSAFTFA
jgi:hypothetical protein